MNYVNVKSTALKENKVQFQAITVAMGYMKPTPTNILLTESEEIPQEERRLSLTLKFIAKVVSYDSYVENPFQKLHLSYITFPPEHSIFPILKSFHMA